MDIQAYKKMLSDWASAQEPVFIVGPERSGTSLLFQQVSNHSSFCDFTHATVETFCFIKPWKLLEAPSPENFEMREYLGHADKLKILQNSITPIVIGNARQTNEGMPLDYINQKNRQEIWFERRYKHILRAFFYLSWKNLGEKRLVEKTPAHIRCLKEIVATFPNALILICTRDIGEIIASHRKRYIKEVDLNKSPDDPSLSWLNKPTEDYIAHLKHIEKTIAEAKKSNIKCMVVPYGDLTNKPDLTMQNVFEFLSLKYSGVNAKQIKRKEQSWDPLLNLPPQTNDFDVSQYLSQRELDLVESAKMSLAGYWR